MTLDENPLLGAQNQILIMNQVDFIGRFNEADRIMIAMPDLYHAGKDNSDEVLRSLRSDFDQSWVISSTRIEYEKQGLEGTITHYFGSTVTEPISTKLVIPVYLDIPILQVVNTEEGLKYLQTLFGTDDDFETIITTLEKLGNKNRSNIRIWTPPLVNGTYIGRKKMPKRASGLNYNFGCFLVLGSFNLDIAGRSRWVAQRANFSKGSEGHQADEDSLDLNLGINSLERNVYASKMQDIGSFFKYSGVFFSDGARYVLTLTLPKKEFPDIDKQIGEILSQTNSSKEKLELLSKHFSPMYAHLIRFGKQETEYSVMDDHEFFEERSRLVVVKQSG